MIGLRELRQRLIESHVSLVSDTREEWLVIADAMIEHPKLVLTYANAQARRKLEGKTEDELREYAFANRVSSW
jgi:hypothetical protein